MVVGQLGITEHADVARPVLRVFQGHVPHLHRLAPGDEQGLHGLDAVVLTFVLRVRKAVTAGVLGLVQGFAHGLPGHGPIFAGVVVPQVDIVAGPVHGHGVGPKTGDAVVFGAFVEQVPPGGVVHHRAQILGTQVIGPADGQVHPVDHIFAAFIVKMAVLHSRSSFGPARARFCLHYKRFARADEGRLLAYL